MVLNKEKRARLAEVLALHEEAVADVGASAPSAPPTNQAVPSPTPSAPLAAVPLATVRASPTPAPLEKGKGVVEIVFDDEEDTMEGPVFKRCKVAIAAISHSSSARHLASFRDHPPSASSPQGFLTLEGGGESVPEPTPAPELPLVLQQILKGYQRGAMGSSSGEAVWESLALSLGEFLSQTDAFSHKEESKEKE